MKEVAVLLNEEDEGILANFSTGSIKSYFKDFDTKTIAGAVVGGVTIVSVPALVGASNPWAVIVAEVIGAVVLGWAAREALGKGSGSAVAGGIATATGLIVAGQAIQILTGRSLISVSGLGDVLGAGGLGSALGGLGGVLGRIGQTEPEIFGVGQVLEPTYDGVNFP